MTSKHILSTLFLVLLVDFILKKKLTNKAQYANSFKKTNYIFRINTQNRRERTRINVTFSLINESPLRINDKLSRNNAKRETYANINAKPLRDNAKFVSINGKLFVHIHVHAKI